MNRRAMFAMVFAVAFGLVAPVAAQGPMGGGPPTPAMRGIWSPVVGSGAAYDMEAKGRKGTMEFAIVGTEPAMGKTGHWLEMMFKDPRQGEMVMKSLIVLDDKNTRVVKMVMYSPEMGAIEFPIEMMGRTGQSPVQEADVRASGELIGTESVTTPAGTFSCQHYRGKDKDGNLYDVWVAEQVAPYGLVKMTSKDSSMVLTRVITGARTRVVGTPRNMRDMMQQRPPQ